MWSGAIKYEDLLDWYEIKPMTEKLTWLAIERFISLYEKLESRENDSLKWGDEIEYPLVKFDHENRRVSLSLGATEFLRQLKETDHIDENSSWKSEVTEFMIESSPGTPYGGNLANISEVEENMRRRRIEASKLLDTNEYLITIPCFPRIGCPSFTSPVLTPDPAGSRISKSLFFPDDAYSWFAQEWKAVVRNMRQRRGSNVCANVPIYRDVNTPKPFREDFSAYGVDGEKAAQSAKDDHIYMDARGCGYGGCALQVTLQAGNMDEARLLYDQLTPITPIMLALSAGTAIYRGYSIDVDTRWTMVSDSTDDRTEEERGLRPLNEDKFRLHKSWFASTNDSYMHPGSMAYNDVNVQYDQKHLDALLALVSICH